MSGMLLRKKPDFIKHFIGDTQIKVIMVSLFTLCTLFYCFIGRQIGRYSRTT